ncbi:MAG: RNA polymerase sigma factor [Patescibacteria group bacterium]|nr:RNA polymerase sigma factor [Patescibacteria group bacterium]
MKDQKDAYMRAYNDYADAIFRHCFFRLSDRERALDITQETFTRAWDYIREGKVVDKWKPFLYRIAGNLVIEEYRKRKTASLDAFLDEETHDEGMLDGLRDDDVLTRLEDAFDGERARAALQKLPETHREVIVLRFIDGLSPKEIAAYLSERENTVSVRIHRALAELRKIVLQP